ncbi:MAG: hypothetical protein ACXVDJ_07080, partial [Tumebacillaceae bacterium]
PTLAFGLEVKMVDQDGNEIKGMKTRSNLSGKGDDAFTFYPILKTTKHLSFVLTKSQYMEVGKGIFPEPGGPWRVDIPLDAIKQ